MKTYNFDDIKVIHKSGIEGPANANFTTGTITFNKDYSYLPNQIKEFIILHEYAHLMLGERNEMKADEFAFAQFAGDATNNLKSAAQALIESLRFDKPEDFARLQQVLNKIVEYDCILNNICNIQDSLKNNGLDEELIFLSKIAKSKYPNSQMLAAATQLKLMRSKYKRRTGKEISASEMTEEYFKRQTANATGEPAVQEPDFWGDFDFDSSLNTFSGFATDYFGTQTDKYNALIASSQARLTASQADIDKYKAQLAAADANKLKSTNQSSTIKTAVIAGVIAVVVIVLTLVFVKK